MRDDENLEDENLDEDDEIDDSAPLAGADLDEEDLDDDLDDDDLGDDLDEDVAGDELDENDFAAEAEPEEDAAEDDDTDQEDDEDDEEEVELADGDDESEESLENLLSKRSAGRRPAASPEEESEDGADIISFGARARKERLTARTDPIRSDQEFVCASCFLVKPKVQLADKERGFCRDCV